jgi:hypothetical protein
MGMPVGSRPGPAAPGIHASPAVIIFEFPAFRAIPCGHGDIRLRGRDHQANHTQHGQSLESGHDGNSIAGTLSIRWLLSLCATCPVASRYFTCRCTGSPRGGCLRPWLGSSGDPAKPPRGQTDAFSPLDAARVIISGPWSITERLGPALGARVARSRHALIPSSRAIVLAWRSAPPRSPRR